MINFRLKFLGLALAGLILGACSQTGTYETADLMNEQAVANKAGFKMTPFGTGNANARTYAASDCVDFCIDPENPEYSVQSAQISNNSGPQEREFTYTVYNTLSGFELGWNYEATNNAGRKLKITVSGAGFASPQTYTSPQQNGGGGSGSTAFTFDESWAACDQVTIVAEILDGDDLLVSGPNTTTYGLIGACGGCDESFDYEQNENGTYTFTYISDSDIDGAKLVFTFAQGIAIAGLEDWSTNGVTKQKTMDISACEINSWTVTLDCASNPGAQNLWTDFTVNTDSKKGSLENIKCE